MNNYVMSDLHGCYDKFIKMLDTIEFKDTDKLYILGDIFDRGDKSLEILDYIINHKNIILLKGNHEKMYEEFFETYSTHMWYHNGGQKTHSQLLNREYEYELAVYKYIRDLQYIEVVDKFILVHAGVYYPSNYNKLTIDEFINIQEEENCLWSRENIDNDIKFKDYTIICGHTPVQSITKNYENVDIIHRNGTIYIDCGCCYERANGKLACLRLNDMKEYYI